MNHAQIMPRLLMRRELNRLSTRVRGPVFLTGEAGFGEELAATGISTAENVYMDHLGNKVWTEPRGTARGYRWPQYSIHRGELQTLLLNAVRDRLGPDAVRTGFRLTGVTQDSTGVTVTAKDRFRNTDVSLRADLLIGADGLHSQVRATLNPNEGPLQWSGVRMWRGISEGAPSWAVARCSMLATNGKHDLSFIPSRNGQPIAVTR